MLDERKKRILKAIIDDYINTAEPIGSRTIARKHEIGLSSATIRNEMADLEDMGFIAQPHTSAGRVPSDKGYRIYVNELMNMKELSQEEIETVKACMEDRIYEMNQLIKRASHIMSNLTKYTTIAVSPLLKRSILKAVQVVPVEKGKSLVVVVTDAGVVRNCIVKLKEDVMPEFLIKTSGMLNEKLSGKTVEQISFPLIRELEWVMGVNKDVLKPILDGVYDCVNQIESNDIFLEGTSNLFNHPEFRNIERAKELLVTLDERDKVLEIMHVNDENVEHVEQLNIRIGSENEYNEIKDCSLITKTYKIGKNIVGTIGVIGPKRMEYSKVISYINYICNHMTKEISKLVEDTNE